MKQNHKSDELKWPQFKKLASRVIIHIICYFQLN